MKRAFVVVLDACGIGALDDAALYGDAGTNTLVHLARLVGGLDLPNLQKLGLGSITAIPGVAPSQRPVMHGRLAAIGPGKDSTAGHWALMGTRSAQPLPTYPEGFEPQVLELITALSGREVLCNRPYNGLDAIDDFGERHLGSGALIVYTSQDSVLQIAAHERVLPADRLQQLCERLRDSVSVGRVIARPFTGEPGAFERTDGRRDFVMEPPTRTYLDDLHEAAVPVHAVGKSGSLFAGRGIDEHHPGPDNATAIFQTTRLMGSLDHGLVFTNLIETDQVYGHRQDASGFARALEVIDDAVGAWLKLLRPDDLFVLTADHGVDITAGHSDHTREYVPLLAVTGASLHDPAFVGRRHDGSMADVGATVLNWLAGAQDPELPGTAFL